MTDPLSVDWLRERMFFWIRVSETLRKDYYAYDDASQAYGKDPYWWKTHTLAKGIIADQRDARDEAIKYAVAVIAELCYLSSDH